MRGIVLVSLSLLFGFVIITNLYSDYLSLNFIFGANSISGIIYFFVCFNLQITQPGKNDPEIIKREHANLQKISFIYWIVCFATWLTKILNEKFTV